MLNPHLQYMFFQARDMKTKDTFRTARRIKGWTLNLLTQLNANKFCKSKTHSIALKIRTLRLSSSPQWWCSHYHSEATKKPSTFWPSQLILQTSMGALRWKAHCHTKAIPINLLFGVRKSGCAADFYHRVGSHYLPKKWFKIYLGKHRTVIPQKLPKMMYTPDCWRSTLVWGSTQTTASAHPCADTHLYQVDKPSHPTHTNTQLQQHRWICGLCGRWQQGEQCTFPPHTPKETIPKTYNPLLNHLYPQMLHSCCELHLTWRGGHKSPHNMWFGRHFFPLCPYSSSEETIWLPPLSGILIPTPFPTRTFTADGLNYSLLLHFSSCLPPQNVYFSDVLGSRYQKFPKQ